jgi:glycosyltransferase involved in cell wall biosynthesis
MKILFFSTYYYPYISGVTTYPQKLLSYLSKKNKIEVLTFKYDKNLKNEEIIDRYKITRMNYWFKISKGFISPQSIFLFVKKAVESDRVILNQPNFEGLLLAVIAKLFGKKIISIFHCQVFLEGNIFNKIINFALNVSMIAQLRLSDKIIGYTKDYTDSLPYFKQLLRKTKWILPPIIYFPPDKELSDKFMNTKKNNIWLGYAGRISNEKGIEYIIEAVRLLNSRNIVLVFAGPYGRDVAGENSYYKKIIKLLKKNSINYIFFGNLINKQLFSFYKSIDILLLPSINQTEAFGMVQAEAILSGTPVIASNLPGVRESIRLTEMGLTVEPKNSHQLSLLIKKILDNKVKYTNSNLLEKAGKLFDSNKVYKFYENLLNNEI